MINNRHSSFGIRHLREALLPLWLKHHIAATLSIFAVSVLPLAAQPTEPVPSPISQPVGLDTTVTLADPTDPTASCSAGGDRSDNHFSAIDFNEEDGSVELWWTHTESAAADIYVLEFIDSDYYAENWNPLKDYPAQGGLKVVGTFTDSEYQVNAHRYYRLAGYDTSGELVDKVEWMKEVSDDGEIGYSMAGVLEVQRYTVHGNYAIDNGFGAAYYSSIQYDDVAYGFYGFNGYGRVDDSHAENSEYTDPGGIRDIYSEVWDSQYNYKYEQKIYTYTQRSSYGINDIFDQFNIDKIVDSGETIFKETTTLSLENNASPENYEDHAGEYLAAIEFFAEFSDFRGTLDKTENPSFRVHPSNSELKLNILFIAPYELYQVTNKLGERSTQRSIGKLVVSWSNSHLNVYGYNPNTRNIESLKDSFELGGNNQDTVSHIASSIDTIWTITPGSVPADKETDITFKVYLPDGTLAIEETRTIEFREEDPPPPPPSPDYYDIPVSDATGPRYRKIALNGRPLSDEAPQATAETDVAREETYVDAFNLGLNHSVTDIYVPLPGSELALSVRRNIRPQIWTANFGLAPDEQPDLPFGMCWSSNITPHVRVVESEGTDHEGYEEPTRAYVTDENGETFEFVQYGTSWFPMPNGSADTKAFTNKLVGTVGGDFTFSKKHGTTISFSGTGSGSITIARERVEGSENTQTFSYARASWVEDRLGYSLNYVYPTGSSGLTPKEIYAAGQDHIKIPGLQIYFWQDNAGRVTQVRDPRGNDITYSYGSTGGHDTLSSVSFPDSSSASYTYLATSEADRTPRNPDDVDINGNPLSPPYADPAPVACDAFSQHIDYFHVNVASITDANSNTYGFSYTFNHSSEYYVQNQVTSGSFVQTGKPMMVREVSLPIGEKATFASLNNRQGNRITASPSGGISGTRVNTVTDATGFTTTYTFSGLDIEILPQFKDIKIGNGQLSDTDPFKNPRILYYTRMDIQHGGYGTETFNFRKDAGLALASATDLSGNTRSYSYRDYSDPDLNKIPVPASLEVVWPGTLYGYYGDPLTESSPPVQVGQSTEYYTTHYTYEDKFRLMDSVIDPRGNLTEFVIDPLNGRQDAVKVFEGSDESKIIRQHTTFLYENNDWPGFVTKETRLKVSDDASNEYSPQSWEHDLVTDYTINTSGRTITSTAYPVKDADDGGVNGLTTTSLHDYNGNLVWTVDPRGHKTRLDYDARNRLTQTQIEDSTIAGTGYVTTHNVFDLRGNRVGTKDENGHYSVFKYDALNRLTSEIRVMGDGAGLNVADYLTFTAYDQQIADDLVTTHTYNPVNALTSTTVANGSNTRLTHFIYDNLQRLRTSANFQSENNELTEDIVTQYIYGANVGGSVFNSETFKPTVVIDPRGFKTTYTYDAIYRPTAVSVDYGDGTATTTTLYDPNGNPVTVTDPLGFETDTEYDALNRPTKVTFADTTYVSTAYTQSGLAYSVTDELLNTTTTEYDGAGRPIKVEQPAVYNVDSGTTVSPITKTFYDEASNVSKTENPNSAEWEYSYDSRNRVTTETQPETTYVDESGVYQTTAASPTVLTEYDNVGNFIKVTDARGNVSYTGYDRANRAIVAVTPQVDVYEQVGATTTASYIASATEYDLHSNATKTYSGRLGSLPTFTSSYSAANAESARTSVIALKDTVNGRENVVNTYDALGRLLSTEDAEGIIVENEYDATSNRTSVEDGLDQLTQFEYDGIGRNTVTRHPDGSTKVLTYDAVNMLSRKDENGKLTTYTYDARHRLENVNYVGASNEDRTYTYDNVGNILSVDEDGTLRDVSYAYDDIYRIKSETSAGITHEYAYDLSGNRLQTIYDKNGSNERTLTSTYDALNRLSTLVEGTRTTTYRYDKSGNIREKTLGNSDVIAKTYDKLNRTATITGPGTSGNELYICTNTYDLYGNLARMVETYPGGNLADRTVINTYDEANRLTQEEITTGAVVVATDYTYDNAHNRITKVVTDDGVIDENLIYSHNNLNQITSYYEDDNNNDSHDVGEALFSFTYDKNGNRISKDDGSATDTLHYYDRENRLIEVVTGTEHTVEIYAGSSASGTPLAIANYTTSQQSSYNYLYDYRTRRVLRDESDASGVATQINYSGGLSIQELTETTPGSGTFDNLLVEYIRGSDYGGGVGGILYSLRSSAPSYYHYNGRGDVTAKTNASGTLGYQAAYEAFGKHDNANASSEEWGTNVDRQQHSTKEEDPTGLQYFHNRYYDIETGTFITRDPLGFVDGPNVYAYVVQNPWTKFDPHGLMAREGHDGYPVKPTANRPPHHQVPVSVWRENKFSTDVQKVLDDATIGKVSVSHGGAAHVQYTERVKAITQDYVSKSGVNPSGLSGKEARAFADGLVNEIKSTNDPYVKGFNQKVGAGATQKELQKWGREYKAKVFAGRTKDVWFSRQKGNLAFLGKGGRAMSGLKAASSYVGRKLPGALRLAAAYGAISEFSSDLNAGEPVSEATRTQYYRFGSLMGETPEENREKNKNRSESFFNWMMNGSWETDEESKTK